MKKIVLIQIHNISFADIYIVCKNTRTAVGDGYREDTEGLRISCIGINAYIWIKGGRYS